MLNNPRFPSPTVPPGEITTQADAFGVKIEQSASGDRMAIAEREEIRDELLLLLNQEAAYVESVAQNMADLLSSGYEAVSTNRTQIELPKPNILRIENAQSQQLALRLGAIPTAKAYEVRMSFGTNGWETVGIFTQARKIVVNDLTPGTTYTFQARAIGGSTGSSEWSDPMSHMSL